MSNSDIPRLAKTAFSVGHLLDSEEEKAFWLAKSPLERLEAMVRQIVYAYDPAITRLQRVLEITKRKSS